MDDLRRQLFLLYDETADNAGKSAASRWLTQFRTTPEAWTLLDQILTSNEKIAYSFYAAQSLHLKVCHDLQDLPSEAVDSLRQSLFQHLHTFQKELPIARKLCAAVASLAVQMSSWLDPVTDVVNLLPADQDPNSLLLQLLLFIELPREAKNRQVYVLNSRRQTFLTYLDAKASFILQHLCHCMQAANGNSVLQEEVFECLESWLYNVDNIPCEALVNNPLVPAAFDALVAPELFDRAVDCICDLIRLSGRMRQYASLSAVIVPRALAAKDRFLQGAVDADDEDMVRGYGRIFAEMGEHYIDFVLQATDEAKSLLTVLVQLTAHPLHDVFLLVWCFWEDFAYMIDAGNDQTKAERKAIFAPAFWQLAENSRRHMMLPDDYEDWTTDVREDYRMARKQEMPRVLRAAASVVGADALLARLVEQAREALPAAREATEADRANGRLASEKSSSPSEVPMSPPVAELEGTLHAMRVLARAVDMLNSEAVAGMLQLLPQLPAHPRVHYTALLIVGRYAEWLRDHNPELLTGQFNFITQCLNDAVLQSAAALAFKFVCSDCAALVVSQFDSLMVMHDAMQEQHQSMSVDDAGEVVAGIASVLLQCTSEQLEPYFGRLCTPYVQQIRSFCEQASNSLSSSGSVAGAASPPALLAEAVVRPLNLLGELLRTARPTVPPEQANPCASVFGALLPTLLNCLEIFRMDSRVVDALCSCFRRATRSYSHHLAEVLPIMLNAMSQHYTVALSHEEGVGAECYLVTMRKAVEELGASTNGALSAPLLSSAEAILVQTNQLIQSAISLSQQHSQALDAAARAGEEPPATPWPVLHLNQCIHDYFAYVTALLWNFEEWACSTGLLSSMLAQIIPLFVSLIPNTVRAAYQFLNELFELCLKRASSQQALLPSLLQQAVNLVEALLRGLAGAVPVGMRHEITSNLWTLRRLIGREQCAQAVQAVADLPFLANLADEHKQALIQAVGHEDDLAHAVEQFGGACLRRKRWLY